MDQTTQGRGFLNTHVAMEIKILLVRRGMTASELARQLGESHSFIPRRLRGERAFDLDDLERIAKIFGVSVKELLPDQLSADRARETNGSKFRLGSSDDQPFARPADAHPIGGPATDLVRRPQRRTAGLSAPAMALIGGRL